MIRAWIRRDPEDADRHALLADHHRQLGDLAAARASYDTAIRLDPDHFQSLMQRAFLFEREGDYESALALYERVVDRLHAAVPVAAQAAQRIEFLREKLDAERGVGSG